MAVGLEEVPTRWLLANSLSAPQKDVTEIQLVEKTKDDSDRMVRQVKPPEKLLEQSQEKARFLSEDEQRVIEETRARKTGLTRNGEALPKNSWLREVRRQEAEQAKNEPEPQQRSPDGYKPIPLPHGRAIAFEDAPSTVGEVLPDDISLGDFTALNTDRFKYYSFYSRIEELVRFRWERDLQAAVENFDKTYLRQVVSRQSWITRIEFTLTADGHFHQAIIHQQSGVQRFDMAAVNAFRDAAVFPNPPREMVKADGLIHIEYSFNVRWSPSAFVDTGRDD